MPSLKSIIEGGPVRTVRFDWGGDEIVMRVRSASVTAGEVEDAEMATASLEGMTEAEQMARSKEISAQMRREISDCLVEWNMWLDDEETQMIRSYEDMRGLPVPFLMKTVVELRRSEADALGERNGASAAG